MDNKLYQLCKEVYERTKWDEKKDYLFIEDSFHASHPEWDEVEIAHHDMGGKGIPLYTSDYLLEKLPRDTGLFKTILSQKEHAYFANASTRLGGEYSDTPLKALLKLVLALKEAKEL